MAAIGEIYGTWPSGFVLTDPATHDEHFRAERMDAAFSELG
jgi:hypothetical protein